MSRFEHEVPVIELGSIVACYGILFKICELPKVLLRLPGLNQTFFEMCYWSSQSLCIITHYLRILVISFGSWVYLNPAPMEVAPVVTCTTWLASKKVGL